jgi:glutamate synthase (NADPH/NADH) small chain
MELNVAEKIEKKYRMKIVREVMPQQDPKDRIRNFKEVPYGLSEEQALVEASRCLLRLISLPSSI